MSGFERRPRERSRSPVKTPSSTADHVVQSEFRSAGRRPPVTDSRYHDNDRAGREPTRGGGFESTMDDVRRSSTNKDYWDRERGRDRERDWSRDDRYRSRESNRYRSGDTSDRRRTVRDSDRSAYRRDFRRDSSRERNDHSYRRSALAYDQDPGIRQDKSDTRSVSKTDSAINREPTTINNQNQNQNQIQDQDQNSRIKNQKESQSTKEKKEEAPVDDETEMMYKLMGLKSFSTTKGKRGVDVGAVSKESSSNFRQYMNREGGFNRDLSPPPGERGKGSGRGGGGRGGRGRGGRGRGGNRGRGSSGGASSH